MGVSNRSNSGQFLKDLGSSEAVSGVGGRGGLGGSGGPGDVEDLREEGEGLSPRSQVAIRADGRLMVSVEDADGFDLRGRVLVTFVLLDLDEAIAARALFEDAQSEISARFLGALPRRH